MTTLDGYKWWSGMNITQYSSNRSVIGIVGVIVTRVRELKTTGREIEPHAWKATGKNELVKTGAVGRI